MLRILSTPWLLLFLAPSVLALDANGSLLSAEEHETIGAAKAQAGMCSAGKFAIRTHVYHIYAGGSGYGLQNHNAGDSVGDLSFVFPRGFRAYYTNGYIAMLHVSVTRWGKYLHCNHPENSHQYRCDGGPMQEYAGRESVAASHGGQGAGHWYSFPARGKDKEWHEIDSKSGPCMMIRIKAKCLISLMAKAGGAAGCSNGCKGKSYLQCSMCMQKGKLPLRHQREVWDSAIWGGRCPRYETEVEDALEADFTNASLSDAPAGSSADNSVVSV